MVPRSGSVETLSWTLSCDSISTKSDRALTTLLTIFCFASSLTAHLSEKRIIFNRCLAMFALELLLAAGDGNIIFHAKFSRWKKFMFIALLRNRSRSWLYSSSIARGRLEWQRRFLLPSIIDRDTLGMTTETPDPGLREKPKSNCDWEKKHQLRQNLDFLFYQSNQGDLREMSYHAIDQII